MGFDLASTDINRSYLRCKGCFRDSVISYSLANVNGNVVFLILVFFDKVV